MKMPSWTIRSCGALLLASLWLLPACASSRTAQPGAKMPGGERGFLFDDDDPDDPLMRPPARDDGTASAEPSRDQDSDDSDSAESGSSSDSESSAGEIDLDDSDFHDFDPDDLGDDDDDDDDDD